METELEVQKYLRCGGTLETLASEYHIKATRHLEHPNLVLLKYNQFDSPFEVPLVQECRGLILDENDGWRVVAMAYKKFFNYGEALAAPIDWSTAKVYEKMDGSLITMYHYAGKWHVSTSGVPDATCVVGDFGLTFAALFWKTFEEQGCDINEFSPALCYMFELCTPQNRVVVRHDNPKIYLHGVRVVKTLEELEPEFEAYFHEGLEAPRGLRHRTSLEACLESAQKLDPLKCEGFVVRDGNFNRLKIKSPAYVALHHCKDGLMNRRHMALLLREGEGSEFETALGAFPELAAEFEALKAKYWAVVSNTEAAWVVGKQIQDRKEFALAVKDLKNSGALFALKSGKVTSVPEYMKTLTEPAYLRLMEI